MEEDSPTCTSREQGSEERPTKFPTRRCRSASSCSSSSSRSSSTSSRSRRLGSLRGAKQHSRKDSSGSQLQRRGRNVKSYNAHVPVFPNLLSPTSIVLEPFPNRRIRSVCTVGGLLVTVHRNGMRIYRQRYLTPAVKASSHARGCNSNNNNRASTQGNDSNKSLTDVRTWLWELVEQRENFHLQDAYLCVAAETVFSTGRVFPLKWDRYVAAACGSDRTRFSVCVLSTAAHFVLHHELHARNKVVAMNFALVSMHLFPESRRFHPFVVSIDEVGEVAIFDVERDRAVKLTLPLATAAATGGATRATSTTKVEESATDVTVDGGGSKSPHPRGSPNDPFYPSGAKRSWASPLGSAEPLDTSNIYRFDAGLASNMCLIGPCKVLCKHCQNNYSGDLNLKGETGNRSQSLPMNPGTLVMSLFISSRAHSAEGQAELQVHHVRFLWSFSPPRAVVLSETPIVRECAPEDVCDIGVAMLQVPFHEDLPPILLIGRPRLRLWGLSACTGKLLQLHRIYRDTDGSGKGARAAREYLVSIVPLGRHTLVQDTSKSWLCSAALTDDNVILLLGQDPLPRGMEESALNINTKVTLPSMVALAAGTTRRETLITTTTVTSDERQTLEAWLDGVEDPKINMSSPPEHSQEQWQQEQEEEETVKGVENAPQLGSPPLTFMDPSQDFTVLMVLAAPDAFPAPPPPASDSRVSPSTRQLLSLPYSNELLFLLGYTDEIYSIRLPFEWHAAPVEATRMTTAAPKLWSGMASRVPEGWIGSALAAGCSLNLGIARPLVSAMWSLTGEATHDEDFLPPVNLLLQNQKEKQDSEAVVPEEEEDTFSTSSRGVMTLRIETRASPTTQRKKRRSAASSVMSIDDRGSDADADADARMSYVVGEQTKLLAAQHRLGAAKHMGEDGCMRDNAALTKITAVDEPLERETVMYEWSVKHDRLYVDFTLESLEIMERRSKTDVPTDGAAIPQKSCDNSLRDRLIMNDLGGGHHSAGFMQAFRHAQQKRRQFHDQAGIFDFTAYFASSVVPQRLLDLQEDDRCRFELADLRAAFEDKIKAFHEVETVVVYENQELLDAGGGDESGRRRLRRRRWVPHSTFPYDTENGDVVDIAVLNATVAASTSTAAIAANVAAPSNPSPSPSPSSSAAAAATASMGWRWESDATEGNAPQTGWSKVVRRELQSWSVGDWMYAARWPNRGEELQGTFVWSATADADVVKVRRRKLSRRRINLAVEAAKRECEEEYVKREEQLRKDLGL